MKATRKEIQTTNIMDILFKFSRDEALDIIREIKGCVLNNTALFPIKKGVC